MPEMKKQNLVIFRRSGNGPSILPFLSDARITSYADVKSFRFSGTDASAFIIDSDDAQYIQALLNELRSDDTFYLKLIFLSQVPEDFDDSLSDGQLPEELHDLTRLVNAAVSRERQLPEDPVDVSVSTRLLRFLWVRPGYVIEPKFCPHDPARWSYPLLERFLKDKPDVPALIESLSQRNLIESLRLVDRQRICSFCDSTRLNFIDTCPLCQSINIDSHSALHCFTCGHVAPESQFLASAQRLCPKCSTKLKHIGSDYDRPLETLTCNSCSHVFVEPSIHARCDGCQKTSKPSELPIQRIHAWTLSSQGRLYCQEGFSQRNTDSGLIFESHFNWLIELAKTDAAQPFSAFAIGTSPLERLEARIGISKARIMLRTLFDRITESLAEHDRFIVKTESLLYVLRPNRTQKSSTRFIDQMRDLQRDINQSSCPELEIQIAEFVATRHTLAKQNALSIMKKLNRSVQESNSKTAAA